MSEFNFMKLPKFKNLRGKTVHKGWYDIFPIELKTDVAIHHSLTDEGDSASFADYHVNTLGWPEVAYHFVILPDGTIEWNHDLGVLSYHVGDANKQAVGVCVVGDFRTYDPTEEQKESLRLLNEALKKDLPKYKRTIGHSDYPQYSWKQCPVFDYKEVLAEGDSFSDVSVNHAHYESIEIAKDLGIFGGYPDGTFRPNDTITRAQMASVMVRLYEKLGGGK